MAWAELGHAAGDVEQGEARDERALFLRALRGRQRCLRPNVVSHPRQRGQGPDILREVSVDEQEHRRTLRLHIIPFMHEHGVTELVSASAAMCRCRCGTHHTCTITEHTLCTVHRSWTAVACTPRAAARTRCAAAGRAAAAGRSTRSQITHVVIPPRSHDLNPLETAFATLQAMVGNCFLHHPAEVSRANIIKKVGEYWPQCHTLGVGLMANQPAVLQEIWMSRGQSTGR